MKPILFNTEMVKAILDGRKTQTRRPIKVDLGKADTDSKNKTYLRIPDEYGDFHDAIEFAKYQIGDVLYVSETFYKDELCTLYKASDYENVESYHGSDGNWHKVIWSPSIHMSKEAARIFLKVKNVKVERFNDINCIDAAKEGFTGYELTGCRLEKFENAWNSIYPDYPSSKNPWVFVYEFERCDKPMER